MEAIENLTAHFPELEPLSQTLRQFNSLCASDLQRGVSEEAIEEEVRLAVTGDLFEHANFAANLMPEIAQLRNICDIPLTGLNSFQTQLQSAFEQNPEFLRTVGGEQLSGGLHEVLAKANHVAPSAECEQLEQWLQEFLQNPMNELLEHGQRVAHFLEGTNAMEQASVQQIRGLSMQINSPGFRPDRVELMDHRSALVQQMLVGMWAKQQSVKPAELKMANFLEEKATAFEHAHGLSLKKHHTQRQHHAKVIEDLGRGTNAMQEYLVRKEAAHAQEVKACEARQQHRTEKVKRLAVLLEEAFAGLHQIIHECRRDEDRLRRCAREKLEAEETVKRLAKQYEEIETLHMANSFRSEMCSALETRFGDWIREAYAAMRIKVAQNVKALFASLPTDKARMLALSRKAIDQVRSQRDQIKRGLEKRIKEIDSRQEDMSLLEFSKPSQEEIAHNTHRIAELKGASEWQQHEVEMLTVVEQKLVQEVNKVLGLMTVGDVGMAGLADLPELCCVNKEHQCKQLAAQADSLQCSLSEEQWSQELQGADAWVANFFSHFNINTEQCALKDSDSWQISASNEVKKPDNTPISSILQHSATDGASVATVSPAIFPSNTNIQLQNGNLEKGGNLIVVPSPVLDKQQVKAPPLCEPSLSTEVATPPRTTETLSPRTDAEISPDELTMGPKAMQNGAAPMLQPVTILSRDQQSYDLASVPSGTLSNSPTPAGSHIIRMTSRGRSWRDSPSGHSGASYRDVTSSTSTVIHTVPAPNVQNLTPRIPNVIHIPTRSMSVPRVCRSSGAIPTLTCNLHACANSSIPGMTVPSTLDLGDISSTVQGGWIASPHKQQTAYRASSTPKRSMQLLPGGDRNPAQITVCTQPFHFQREVGPNLLFPVAKHDQWHR